MRVKTVVKKTLMGSVFAISVAFQPFAVSAESLGDALAAAYKNSGLLDQNRANLRATDEGVAAAVAAMRPSLTYRGSTGFGPQSTEWSTTLAFTASMTLYTFGRNQLNLDAAKETVLATRASLVGIEQSVLSDAVSAYMDVRYQEAQVNLRQNSLRLTQQNLRAAQDRFEVGEITRTEVAQVEAQLASARALLAAAVGQASAARETYKVTVGHYPSDLSSPPAVKLPARSVDAAVAIAVASHPSIKALQHRISALDLAVEIAKRGLLPKITGSATVSNTDGIGGDAQSESFGIVAEGTIFAGGALTSAIRKAMADRDAVRAQLHLAVKQIEQGVRTSWAMLSVYSASAEATSASVEAQRVAYQGVKEEANLGASTTLDVLNAEQDLLNAQVSAIQARIDRETSVYTVLASMGLLTVDHLKLNVPVYDPAAYYTTVQDAPVTYVSPEGAKLDRVLKALGRE